MTKHGTQVSALRARFARNTLKAEKGVPQSPALRDLRARKAKARKDVQAC